MPKYLAVRIRVSATDVRELVSSASDRTRPIGTFVKMATDATGPSDATAQSGTIAYPSPRRYSIDGISPRSISPACSNLAHVLGKS